MAADAKEKGCLGFFFPLSAEPAGFRRVQLPSATFVCRLCEQPSAALAPERFKEGNGCWHLIFIDPAAEKNHDRKPQRRPCIVNLKCPSIKWLWQVCNVLVFKKSLAG